MINKLLNNPLLMEKALDASWLRNKVISNNIANVDTPGYKRQKVEFEKHLQEALGVKDLDQIQKPIRVSNTNKANVHRMEPKVISENWTSNRVDKNNVNIDVEMSELTSNTLMYNTLIQQINRSYSSIKSVINEGRK